MLCCGGDGNHADDFEPIPYRDEKQQVEELRGRLSAIMQPLEVGFDQQATVNLSMTRPRPNTPAGAFERRQSVSFRAAPAAGQRAGPAGGPALQWTDSRKLLEAAIAMEQIEPDVPAAIPEYAPPAGAGWGWAAERDALAAEEARLQRRLWKLKLEHFVMEGDGNCQFRAVSFGLYGTPRHHGYVRRKAVEYMRAARGDFEAFLGEDFASYLRQMARAGTWGDELTLRAVSEALATVVNVISSDAAHWFMRYIPRTTRPQHEIFVTYIAPLHYNAIRRQNTGTRLRASFGRQGSQLARAVSTYQRRYGIPETPQHVVAAATGG